MLAVALAKTLGVKCVYLVATKALQQQVLRDFDSIGMRDIRGRANYTCQQYGDCDKGADEDCKYAKSVQCPYALALSNANNSDLILTNYSYWLAARRASRDALESNGEKIGLLVCDEAHALESQLTGFAQVSFSAWELDQTRWSESGMMEADLKTEAEGWRAWAKLRSAKAHATMRRVEERNSNYRHDKTWIDANYLSERCGRILKMTANWVWQFDSKGNVSFQPIRLSQYSKALFSGVPRVLLMSASLNEFTCRLLLPQDLSYDYRAWSTSWPTGNAPIYHIPTRKLSWKSTEEDYQVIIAAADSIIDARQDRKGIIHTVSYARSQRALQYSRHAGRFIWNGGSRELESKLVSFRQSVSGILVTPSVSAGFDFPGAQAEYQIILKFPFPNEKDRVVKERCTQIPGYRLNAAAQEVVQMCGRIRRYEADRGETFILDNAVAQLKGPAGAQYCPKGFRIFTVNEAPAPPPKLSA